MEAAISFNHQQRTHIILRYLLSDDPRLCKHCNVYLLTTTYTYKDTRVITDFMSFLFKIIRHHVFSVLWCCRMLFNYEIICFCTDDNWFSVDLCSSHRRANSFEISGKHKHHYYGDKNWSSLHRGVRISACVNFVYTVPIVFQQLFCFDTNCDDRNYAIVACVQNMSDDHHCRYVFEASVLCSSLALSMWSVQYDVYIFIAQVCG